MKVKQGTIVEVNHSRSGKWTGIARKDFDTDDEGFYPINLHQEHVRGKWFEGDEMPARNTLCTVVVVKRV